MVLGEVYTVLTKLTDEICKQRLCLKVEETQDCKAGNSLVGLYSKPSLEVKPKKGNTCNMANNA